MELRIGILGIINKTFPGDLDRVYNRFLKDAQVLAARLDFEVIAPQNAFDNLDEVKKYLAELEERAIDFLLIQVCSFASGKIMEAIGKSGFPLGIWGLPEPVSHGAIQLNSLCGMNMFCSILKTYLKDTPVKYKWFFGKMEDREFRERFSVTIRALKAIKRLKGLRLGIVGGIAPGFLNVYADRRKLEKRFGVEVADYDFSEIQRIIEHRKPDQPICDLAEQMAREVDIVSDDVRDKIVENAIVYDSIKNFAEKNQCGCLSISCWPQFRRELGLMPCAAFGRLTDSGIIAACEGDIEGALSMYILQTLAASAPMIMDFVDLDLRTEAVQYWHCGNAPPSTGKQGTIRLGTHFKPGSRITCEDSVKVGTVYDMIFETGEYTVFRLMDDGSKCLLFSGEMLDDEMNKGFDGTRGWLGKLNYCHRNLPLWDLMNTIMSEGIPHHHCLVKGNVVDTLAECMSWFGVKIIEPLEYTDTVDWGTRDAKP